MQQKIKDVGNITHTALLAIPLRYNSSDSHLRLCVSLPQNKSNRDCSANYHSIIGGGTAGLTIAARLTEDPEVSVIVLEAGNDHSNDTNVLSPGLCTTMYGDPEYDWNYSTVPQVCFGFVYKTSTKYATSEIANELTRFMQMVKSLPTLVENN